MDTHETYDDKSSVLEQPAEAKLEKFEIAGSSVEACSSACTNTEENMDAFVKSLSYDEIISSIEIVKQLQKAFMDASENEDKEECLNPDTKIKQEKNSNEASTGAGECLQDQQSYLQGCVSSKSDHGNKCSHTEKENQVSSDLVSSIVSELFFVLSSDTANKIKRETLRCEGDINRIKEEDTERERHTPSSVVDLKKYEEFILPSTENISEERKTRTCVDANELVARTKDGENATKEIPSNSISYETSGEEPSVGSEVDKEPNARKGSETSWRNFLDTKTPHTKKPYKCQLCEYESNISTNFRQHMMTHTDGKPYKCEICERKFRNKYELKLHTRCHTGEKPFTCKHCQYKGRTKHYLTKHQRSHTGERPYTCTHCQFKCSASSDLKRHVRSHTGEKPYKCKICEFRFSYRSNLNQHMRIHSRKKF